MITRRSAMAIAEAYTERFSFTPGTHSNRSEKVYRDNLYDYLFEHEYQAWFCNMVKVVSNLSDILKNMTRPLRIEYAGAWYHVMSRGNSGRKSS